MVKQKAKLSDIRGILEKTVHISTRHPAYLTKKEANALAAALLRICSNVDIIMKTDDNDAPVMVITVKHLFFGGKIILPIISNPNWN